MASIGRLQFNPADNSFTGFLKTMTLNANITLQPIASPGPNGPHWRVLAENGFELGAGWKKTSQQGAEYVSLSFDAPGLREDLRMPSRRGRTDPHARIASPGTREGSDPV